MLNSTMTKVVSQSLVYSYMLSQPFAVYADAYPVLQNEQLLEAEHIQYGEHSQTVRVLQEKMNKLDYYDDQIDGDFGILTEQALKKIQVELNVDITGEADYQTLRGMIEMEKQTYLDQLGTMSEAVYPGMKSKDVKIVQQALHYFGYYTGEIDGLFGPLTTRAVEKAEENHDIQLTPEVTEESVQALYDTDKETHQEPEQTEATTENTTTEENTEENVSPEQSTTPSKTEGKTRAKSNTKEKDEPETKQVTTSSNVFSQIAKTAQSFIGTPYVWGGTSPDGFDCSGFIQYVFKTNDMTVPRTVSDMWNFSTPVDTRSIGDLVFFETYKPGPSHMGIYIGDGRFVHAGSSNGVAIGNLSDSYWKQSYIGTKRPQ